MPCPMCRKEHTETVADALTEMAKTPRRLERLTKGLTTRRLSHRLEEAAWSPKEIIAHLADCELVYGFRYRKILAEPGSSLSAFDQDAWATGLQYQNQEFKPLLESFAVLRRVNLGLLRIITRDAWNKAGRHPEYGTLTIGQLVLHLVTHDRNHIAQVEDRLGRPRLP